MLIKLTEIMNNLQEIIIKLNYDGTLFFDENFT